MIEDYLQARRDVAAKAAAIADVARKCHRIRTGHDLISEFAFTGFRKLEARDLFDDWFTGTDDHEYPQPVYPAGTPLIEVQFYHHRWNDDRDIALPASYFEPGFDYVSAETQAMAETKARLEERERERAEAAAIAQEAQERETLRNLQSKYGSL